MGDGEGGNGMQSRNAASAADAKDSHDLTSKEKRTRDEGDQAKGGARGWASAMSGGPARGASPAA